MCHGAVVLWIASPGGDGAVGTYFSRWNGKDHAAKRHIANRRWAMRCSRAASTDRCCLRHSGTSRFTRAQFTLPPRLKRSCVLCPRLLIQIESIEDQGFAFCGENTTVRLAPATVARYVEYIRNVQLTGAHQFANVSVYGQVLYPCSTSFAVCRRLCCQGCFVRPFKLSFQNDAIAANDCGQPSPRTIAIPLVPDNLQPSARLVSVNGAFLQLQRWNHWLNLQHANLGNVPSVCTDPDPRDSDVRIPATRIDTSRHSVVRLQFELTGARAGELHLDKNTSLRACQDV